jgi:hypothetical protein
MSVKGQKYTWRRRSKKNHIEEYHMPAAGWDTIANARRKLVRPIAHPVHEIISRQEKTEEMHTREEKQREYGIRNKRE